MSPDPKEEEPVAYLGGKAAEPEGQVEGYLGGQTSDAKPAEEELPALPPAGVSAVYSASDFIAPPPETEEEAPPAYDSYAADPVAEPAPAAADVEQYSHESTSGTKTVVEEPSSQPSSDFDEPGLPKTISQQDAENIIKRITTKKILPPEVAASDGPRVSPSPELTPRGTPKLGRIVVVMLLILGLYGGAVAFREDVGPFLPEVLWPYIFYTPPPPPPVEKPKDEMTPEMKKEKALRHMVFESEWRAFDYKNSQEFEAAQREAKTTGTKTPDNNKDKPADGSGDVMTPNTNKDGGGH
ncbi:MAG TPA: hypothetical protein VFF73_38770 [Planctomycetota bacterium]|nr:hypothetical protein [Planctomycetota bacterium]